MAAVIAALAAPAQFAGAQSDSAETSAHDQYSRVLNRLQACHQYRSKGLMNGERKASCRRTWSRYRLHPHQGESFDPHIHCVKPCRSLRTPPTAEASYGTREYRPE